MCTFLNLIYTSRASVVHEYTHSVHPEEDRHLKNLLAIILRTLDLALVPYTGEPFSLWHTSLLGKFYGNFCVFVSVHFQECEREAGWLAVGAHDEGTSVLNDFQPPRVRACLPITPNVIVRISADNILHPGQL